MPGLKWQGFSTRRLIFYISVTYLGKSLQVSFNRRRMTSTRQPMEDLMMKEMMETSTTTPLKKMMTLLTLTSQLMRMKKSNPTLRMMSRLERSLREEMVFKLRLTRSLQEKRWEKGEERQKWQSQNRNQLRDFKFKTLGGVWERVHRLQLRLQTRSK